MPQITFLPGNIKVEMPAGSSLLEGARHAGVFVETPCGGKGTCQKCLVRLIKSNAVSKGGTVNDGGGVKDVLICQTMVPDTSITVELAVNTGGEGQFENFEDPSKYLPEKREPFLKKINLQIAPPALLDGLSDADRFSKAFMKAVECDTVNVTLSVLTVLPEKLRFADGKIQVYYFIENNIAAIVDISPERAYGIAVDIGTTTVALWLVDIESGKVLAAHNAYNGQVECGLDVISRINYAKKFLPELQSRILQTINGLTAAVCKDANITPNMILCVSPAGNTTMTHLLLGIVPEYIRLSPYTPAVFIPQTYTAGQVGISTCENAPVLFAPAVGSYVGGDITAGLLCTGLATNSDELVLFIDIGTNGEIVLGNRDFIFACACSAGPAFEGGGIKHGIRARSGAIERVIIGDNGKPVIQTIGNAPPIGICGSGIISAIAEFFRKGIIDSAGKYAEKNGEYALCEGISISETDIDNFIRAKGAIFSACQTMLDSVGFSFDDVDRFYVAGGFGRFLDLEDARTIGLLPRLSDEKFTFLGNTSVIGAYLALISEEPRAKEHELAARITYMDLSSEHQYMDHYTAALFLPHTDQKLFE
jgi:uncharacterized 2Fe-2S/4Fe-4S cluster protein (DUF4445 family)